MASKKIGIRQYLRRYYAHRGAVKSIRRVVNLLGEKLFREVTFADGSFITLCPTYDNSARWREVWRAF